MEGGAGPGLCRREPLVRCRRRRPRLRRGSRRQPRLPHSRTSRPAPCLPALFSIRSPGRRGAAERPHQSAHALTRRPSGLRAEARPRRLSSDPREAQTGAGAAAPDHGQTRWLPGTGAKGPFSPVPVPPPLAPAGAWPRAPNTRGASAGRTRRSAAAAAARTPRVPGLQRARDRGKRAAAPAREDLGSSPPSEEPGVLAETLRARRACGSQTRPRPSTEARGGDATAAP